jgi:hypothetical protein
VLAALRATFFRPLTNFSYDFVCFRLKGISKQEVPLWCDYKELDDIVLLELCSLQNKKYSRGKNGNALVVRIPPDGTSQQSQSIRLGFGDCAPGGIDPAVTSSLHSLRELISQVPLDAARLFFALGSALGTWLRWFESHAKCIGTWRDSTSESLSFFVVPPQKLSARRLGSQPHSSLRYERGPAAPPVQIPPDCTTQQNQSIRFGFGVCAPR